MKGKNPVLVGKVFKLKHKGIQDTLFAEGACLTLASNLRLRDAPGIYYGVEYHLEKQDVGWVFVPTFSFYKTEGDTVTCYASAGTSKTFYWGEIPFDVHIEFALVEFFLDVHYDGYSDKLGYLFGEAFDSIFSQRITMSLQGDQLFMKVEYLDGEDVRHTINFSEEFKFVDDFILKTAEG